MKLGYVLLISVGTGVAAGWLLKPTPKPQYIQKITIDSTLVKSVDSLKAINSNLQQRIINSQSRINSLTIQLHEKIKTIDNYSKSDIRDWVELYRTDSIRYDMP